MYWQIFTRTYKNGPLYYSKHRDMLLFSIINPENDPVIDSDVKLVESWSNIFINPSAGRWYIRAHI